MFTFDISVKHYQRSPVEWEAGTDGCKQLQVSSSLLLTSDEILGFRAATESHQYVEIATW